MSNTGEKHAHFFSHKDCEYFPCHPCDAPEDFNCLFCYCPLYSLGEACGGQYSYTPQGIKDCSGCTRPHRRDSFEKLMCRFPEIAELARKKS